MMDLEFTVYEDDPRDPEDDDDEEEPVGLRVGSWRGGRSVADMDRPCRDGADRAERRNRRLTSSFSWRPSSSSPSCHPLPSRASRGW